MLIDGLFVAYLVTTFDTGMLKGTTDKGVDFGMFIGRLLFVGNIILYKEKN